MRIAMEFITANHTAHRTQAPEKHSSQHYSTVSTAVTVALATGAEAQACPVCAGPLAAGKGYLSTISTTP